MTYGITTSIRLPPTIRTKLEKAAHSLHKGKNWIITKALEEYLTKINQQTLASEAKRQSILASQAVKKEEADWETNSDDTGWR